MANYFYLINPKVAERLSLTSAQRYTFPDGVMLAWQNDLKEIDRVAFFRDRKGLLARLGAVEITDPQAREEQIKRTIPMPMATDPAFMWEAPDIFASPDETPEEDGDPQEDSDDTPEEGEDEP